MMSTRAHTGDGDGVLIVGGGLAGLRCATTLRSVGYSGQITLVGAERHLPYERPALSKQLLTGTKTIEQLALTSREILARQQISLKLEFHVEQLDRAGTATSADGHALSWNSLVLATGARARQLPGTEGFGNVQTLRTLDECSRVARAAAARPAPGDRWLRVRRGRGRIYRHRDGSRRDHARNGRHTIRAHVGQ